MISESLIWDPPVDPVHHFLSDSSIGLYLFYSSPIVISFAGFGFLILGGSELLAFFVSVSFNNASESAIPVSAFKCCILSCRSWKFLNLGYLLIKVPRSFLHQNASSIEIFPYFKLFFIMRWYVAVIWLCLFAWTHFFAYSSEKSLHSFFRGADSWLSILSSNGI